MCFFFRLYTTNLKIIENSKSANQEDINVSRKKFEKSILQEVFF